MGFMFQMFYVSDGNGNGTGMGIFTEMGGIWYEKSVPARRTSLVCRSE